MSYIIYYKKEERSFEEAKRLALQELQDEIYFWNRFQENDLKENDLDRNYLITLCKEKIKKINELNDEKLIWKNQPEDLSKFINNTFYVVCEMISNIIHYNNNHIINKEINLFSLEETLKYIEEKNDLIFYSFDDDCDNLKNQIIIKIKNHWIKYPDGMISFE